MDCSTICVINNYDFYYLCQTCLYVKVSWDPLLDEFFQVTNEVVVSDLGLVSKTNWACVEIVAKL